VEYREHRKRLTDIHTKVFTQNKNDIKLILKGAKALGLSTNEKENQLPRSRAARYERFVNVSTQIM
jgi:hypothetical protein